MVASAIRTKSGDQTMTIFSLLSDRSAETVGIVFFLVYIGLISGWRIVFYPSIYTLVTVPFTAGIAPAGVEIYNIVFVAWLAGFFLLVVCGCIAWLLSWGDSEAFAMAFGMLEYIVIVSHDLQYSTPAALLGACCLGILVAFTIMEDNGSLERYLSNTS